MATYDGALVAPLGDVPTIPGPAGFVPPLVIGGVLASLYQDVPPAPPAPSPPAPVTLYPESRYIPGGEDVDFGSDLFCDDDLRPDFGELESDDPLVVAQACYRRLQSPRGILDDDGDYGLDVRRWLHQPTTTRQFRENEGRARAELLKDDRVESVEVTLSRVGPAEIELVVVGQTATGPFTLILAVTSADVLLKEIR